MIEAAHILGVTLYLRRITRERDGSSSMSERTQPGEEKKLLLAPCAKEYTASLRCEHAADL